MAVETQTETQEVQTTGGETDTTQDGGSGQVSREDYAGVQRALTEMQEGRRLPEALRNKGYENLDDIPSADEVSERRSDEHDTSGDRGRGNRSRDDDEGFDRDPATGRPRRPRRSAFREEESGDLDEDAYDDAMERYEDGLGNWERQQGERADAEKVEAKAADAFMSSDAAKPFIEAFGGKRGQVRDVALVLAANIAGTDGPASSENVADGAKAMQAAFDAYLNAHAEEALERARKAAAEEGTSVQSVEGGRTSTEGAEGKKDDETVPGFYTRKAVEVSAGRH